MPPCDPDRTRPRRPRGGAALAGALLLLLLLVPVGRLGAAPEDEAPAPDVAAALEALTSPRQSRRRAAVERLVARMPDARETVIAALEDASPEVRLHLVEVLAADASPRSITTLLGLLQGSDARLAAHVRDVLVRDAHATRLVLEAWARDPSLREGEDGQVPDAVRDLEALLQRAEVERLFLERKSSSGLTGYYEGQYEALRAYREQALVVLVSILRDRALPVPGRVMRGPYAFLRPLPHQVDTLEVQGMAAGAFAELAQVTDTLPVFALHREMLALRPLVIGRGLPFGQRELERVSRYIDLVVALYLVSRKDQPSGRLEADPLGMGMILEELIQHLVRSNRRGSPTPTYLPAVLLRVGRYEEAIQAYQQALDQGGDLVSPASAHYNLACAYASWAEESEGRARERRLDLALDHLERAVDHRWSDVGWMAQDRDLDPIRDTARYRALEERIRQAVDPDREPSEDD